MFIQQDDIVKILNCMLDNNSMNNKLKEAIYDYLEHNFLEYPNLSYQAMAEISVAIALKMDPGYKKMFFNKMRDKFLGDFRHLDEETMFKILWSLLKSGHIQISSSSADWENIKTTIIKRSKELSPKIMSDLLVLSTAETSLANKDDYDTDLFSKIEE